MIGISDQAMISFNPKKVQLFINKIPIQGYQKFRAHFGIAPPKSVWEVLEGTGTTNDNQIVPVFVLWDGARKEHHPLEGYDIFKKKSAQKLCDKMNKGKK